MSLFFFRTQLYAFMTIHWKLVKCLYCYVKIAGFGCTVRNVQFTKILCYKGNVKFDDIYDVFE